jgi:hypothetical protein
LDFFGAAEMLPSVASLSRCAEFHGRTIVVSGITLKSVKIWCAFFEEIAQMARNLAQRDRASFVCIVKGELTLQAPRSSPGISVLRWNDVSSLDMLLYASTLLDGQSTRTRLTQAAMIAAVAQFDPVAAKIVASCDQNDRLDLERALDAIASDRGWLKDPATWWNGAVMMLDREPVYHAAHPLGRGRLDRLIWRSQLATLFPILEEHRLAVLHMFEHVFGTDAFNLDYGEIVYRLRAYRRKHWLPPNQLRIIEDFERLRRMRNSLAHGAPLSSEQLGDPLLYGDFLDVTFDSSR